MNKLNQLQEGLSVILISAGGPDLLDRFLENFSAHNSYRPLEILVADLNGDDLSEVIKKYQAKAFIHQVKNCSGNLSAAINKATRRAAYSNILITNANLKFTADVIPKAMEALAEPARGVVGIRLDDDPGLLAPGKEPGIRHSGVGFEWDKKEGFYRPVQIGHASLSAAKDLKNDYYPAVTGAFLLCRKADFDALGGFCEQYDQGFEDIDFCLRLKTKRNKSCYCLNEISLQYSEGVVREKIDPEVSKHNDRVFKERMGQVVATLMQLSPEKKTKKEAENESVANEKKLQPELETDDRKDQLKALPTLRILYVLPVTFDCNSGYHVQRIIDHLKPHGVEAVVAIPGAEETLSSKHSDQYTVRTFKDILRKGLAFSDGQGPDLIHAWTPREVVRKFVKALGEKCPCPVIVHLEDNEEYLLEASLGRPYAELEQLPLEQLDSLVPQNWYHPAKGKAFLKNARALTMVIDTLQKFNYGNLPALTIPPQVDESLFYPRPVNYKLRRKLGIPDDHTVLVYNGNVHKGNCHEVLDLYGAVEVLNHNDHPTILLRTGINHMPFFKGKDSEPQQYEKALGWVDREEVPELMAAADIFVQPGSPGPFNDYRIPCKLPEYFAMGRPVILPKTNLGLLAKHGKDAFVLSFADVNTMAEAIVFISKGKKLADSLAEGAVDFYMEQLSCNKIGENLLAFYSKLLKCFR